MNDLDEAAIALLEVQEMRRTLDAQYKRFNEEVEKQRERFNQRFKDNEELREKRQIDLVDEINANDLPDQGYLLTDKGGIQYEGTRDGFEFQLLENITRIQSE